jgi:hypothetical protein
MRRILQRLLVVVAVLFSQQAAQAHDFQHVQKGTPASQHLGAKCLAFHAVDSALPNGAVHVQPARIVPPDPTPVALPLSRTPRIEFDSRAPPSLS